MCGVYGESDSSDARSNLSMIKMQEKLTEVATLFNTNLLIMSGDFNVTISLIECSSARINKPATSQTLKAILQQFNLTDADGLNPKRTWRRRRQPRFYSRIDYIFASTGIQISKFKNNASSFSDHSCLSAELEIGKNAKPPPPTKGLGIGYNIFPYSGF